MLALPQHPADEKSSLQQPSEQSPLPVASDVRPQVLIVEDNQSMARMLAVTLATTYRVTTAHDGEEGLKQAIVLRPDLLLCDMSMPRMSGEQLVTELRTRHDFDEMPIMVLSGHTDEQLRIQMLRAGAQDYLLKPFNREELRVRVANLLMVQQARQHLLAMDRMKSEFVSLASHELRTPLTSIKGYIDLILNDDSIGELNGLQHEFLEIALNNARRLERLINDLLDLSHIESGKLELHCEPFDINRLISEVMPSFQPAWNAKKQTFTPHLPDEVPLIRGDADRVAQILTNLLSNAHKYTPDGGSIDLSVEITGPFLSIAVTDSGIGLSAEEQVHLFTRFYRAHSAETISGTGLGLVITRSLVEMQGGEIEVVSEPGHGSTFRFTLPFA